MLANFKYILAAKRILQVDLALKLGIPPDHISRIITGRVRAQPSIRRQLAEALGVRESWLFSSKVRIPAPNGASSAREGQETL